LPETARGLTPEQSPPPSWDLIDAASVVCFDAGAVGLAAWLGSLAGEAAGPYVAALVRPAVTLSVVALVARRWWRADIAALGVRLPEPGSWWWFVKFSLIVGAGYLVLGATAAGVYLALWGAPDAAELSVWARAVVRRQGGFLPMALVGLIMAPVAEELVFRGVLYPALRGRIGRARSLFGSAAVFAAMHPLWAMRLYPPVTQLLGGLVFAWSYEKTRSLVHPMIFHAVGNGAILVWHLVLIERPGWIAAVLG
jgi:membrane protease YdiL (CAAX protease family)